MTIRPALLACALWLPAACFAGIPGTVSGAAEGVSQYRLPGQLSGCSYSGGTSNGCGYMNNSGGLPFNSSDGQLWTSTSALFSADLSSAVDANGLHARASLSITNDPLDPGAVTHYAGSDPASAGAIATWSDTLTISGPASASMVFGFTLDGNLSAMGSGHADAKVSWFASSSSGASSSGQWTFSTLSAIGPALPTLAQLSTNLAVQPGDVVTLQLRLIAQAEVGCQALHGPMLCTASAASDMSNTLKFSSIAFQDGTGQSLAGYDISSANFDYDGLIVGGPSMPVPEPGTALLFALGLIGLRRSRNRSEG